MVDKENKIDDVGEKPKDSLDVLSEREVFERLISAIQSRSSIYDLFDKDQLLQSIQSREFRAQIVNLIRKRHNSIKDLKESDEITKQQSFIPEIEMLELMIDIEERPLYLGLLSAYFSEFGRQQDSLDYLMKAASESDNFIDLYLQNCHQSNENKRIIDFFEANRDRVIRLPENICLTFVAIAYERTSHGSDMFYKSYLHKAGYNKESYESMAKAKELYGVIYERVIKSGGKSPGEILDIINYAQSLVQEANIAEDLSGDDLHEPPDTYELRIDAISILKDVLAHLENLQSIYALDDIEHPVLENMYLAKLHLTNAYGHEKFTIEELEYAIGQACDLLSIEPDYLIDKGWYDTALNNYVLLLQDHAEKSGELFASRGDEEESKKIENILWIALKYGWADQKSWQVLIDFYSADENEDPQKIKDLRKHRDLALYLRGLVDFDKLESPSDGFLLKLYEETGEADEDCDQLIEHVKEHGINIDSCFQPLFDAIQPYIDEYKDYLANIAPSECDIEYRLKSFVSIILKMLKEKKDKITQITDIVGFRVLTNTEDEVREFYKQVKDGFDKSAFIKEWNTLDEPTETNYRSLDITGHPSECPEFLVQVQVRSKSVEKEIQAGYAHHSYMKKTKGEELEEEIAKDPILYVNLLAKIFENLFLSAQAFKQTDGEMPLQDVLNYYENPPV